MSKSYEEQIKELQNKISMLKKQQKEQTKKRIQEVGQAFVKLHPAVLDKFDEEGFNLEEYMKGVLGIEEDIPQVDFSDEEGAVSVQQTEVGSSYGTYQQNNF